MTTEALASSASSAATAAGEPRGESAGSPRGGMPGAPQALTVLAVVAVLLGREERAMFIAAAGLAGVLAFMAYWRRERRA